MIMRCTMANITDIGPWQPGSYPTQRLVNFSVKQNTS